MIYISLFENHGNAIQATVCSPHWFTFFDPVIQKPRPTNQSWANVENTGKKQPLQTVNSEKCRLLKTVWRPSEGN